MLNNEPHTIWVLEWLNWHLYAYWPDLLVCLWVAYARYCVGRVLYSSDGLAYYAINPTQASLVLFVGFCLWVAYCAIRYGYAVG